MKIRNLKLINYRNYENLNLEFSDTLNLIYGNNGSGKSNLIEAIYLLALTKSFRTKVDKHLIKNGTQGSSIIGNIVTNDETKYQLDITNEGKKVFINSDKMSKMSDYVSKINIVLYNPLDTKIISDSPSYRRKVLNIEISQLYKEYIILFNNYEKVLKNRNAYLKQLFLNGNASSEYLDILTMKLIDYGIQLHKYRKEFIEKINDNISKIYKNIFEYGDLKVKYISEFNNKTSEEIHNMYKKNYQKEISFGKTLFGIHHDDMEFILDGHEINEYGSVGQQKNAIISFKLSELLIIKKEKGEYSILILDDLFSELDKNKINNIIKMLNKEVQTFITTTNIDNVDKNLINDSWIFKVSDGTVERIEQ